MLLQLSEELYLQLMAEVDAVLAAEKDEVKRLVACIPVVRKYLDTLRELFVAYPLENQKDEICFFRSIKPRFYQWLIYYVERYTVLMSRPLSAGKELQRHYCDQLKFYRRALRQHEFYYQYYKIQAVEMDYLYFTRGAEVPSLMLPEMPEVDRSFSTALDYLFARFLAYEALEKYFAAELERLSGGGVAGAIEENEVELNWTGDTINLLEVAYGLHYSRQINNGKASVADIVRRMEKVFSVTIGRPYRRLTEIKQRKRLSRTKFLDDMAKAFRGRMDDDDAYDPDAGK